MKSERRHELQHNELADWMVKVIDVTKPYANVILGGVLVVAIAAVLITFMSQRSSAEANLAWEDFYTALSNRSFAELDNVVEHYPGSDAAHWASVVVGDLHFAQACDEIFTSQAGATQELKKAIANYEQVLEDCSQKEIRQQATFGLARALEVQGDLDKAKATYKKLIALGGPYTAVAKARVADLDKPSIQQFYKDFEPKPAFSGPSPVGPLQLDNLDMPGSGGSLFDRYDTPGSGAGLDLPPIGSTPAESSTPAPAAPETTTPGADTPAPAAPDASTSEPAPKSD